jgi:crotonobetainyl-CoA:carnitine CoA-transferase CaiB-like acyl-CoA transferase
MERLGLGWDVLKEINPRLVMISASGTGQSGPTRHYAAYGTLLQIYTGFAGLNGYPQNPPSIGMAWADPLCGMLLAHAAVAALRSSRNTSEGSHIDFSMVEAVLATMPGPLIEYQLTGDRSERIGNTDENFYPHGVFKAFGNDSWVAIAVTDQDQWKTLAKIVDAPADLMGLDTDERRLRSDVVEKLINAWICSIDPEKAMEILQEAGVPASVSFTSEQLTSSHHLNKRGFFEMLDDRNGESRLMPTLPWHWDGDINLNFGRPPDLGGDTKFVLRSILGYSDEDIDRMEKAGALT